MATEDKYRKKLLPDLRSLAQMRGLNLPSRCKKQQVIDILIAYDREHGDTESEASDTHEGRAESAGMEKRMPEESDRGIASETAAPETGAAGTVEAETRTAETRAPEHRQALNRSPEGRSAFYRTEYGRNAENRTGERRNFTRVKRNYGEGERGSFDRSRQAGSGENGARTDSRLRQIRGRTTERSGITQTDRRTFRPKEYIQPQNGAQENTAAQRDEAHENISMYDSDMPESAREAAREAAREQAEIPKYKDAKPCRGMLEILPEGYGFLRGNGYSTDENDVYVSPSQIRRFRLRTGDMVTGETRKNNPTDKYGALLFMDTVNGKNPDENAKRIPFEKLTPIFPNDRIRLERAGGSTATRLVDLVSPIGKGQRGMIVSQPKAGKTTLLKEIALSVMQNHSDIHLIILLIDERPEEVTDMKETIRKATEDSTATVEVVASTFDETPENHKRISEIVIEHARRLVEDKRDVMILLDSITRLARAYNLTVPPSGRTLSGGLDPTALYMPKRFFGAARNMREGGSLTILATALVDTGSRMDDVVFEEFKGTGNMELVLDRSLSERRVFPAIDLARSSTRRDDMLLTREEMVAMNIIRKGLSGMKSDEAIETVLTLIAHTKTNYEFCLEIVRMRNI